MSTQTEKKFRLGASYTIGLYILPGKIIDTIYQKVDGTVKLTIGSSAEIVNALQDKQLDLAFIESPDFDNSLVYVEWMNDEMVVCSKKRLPNSLNRDDLNNCQLISREKNSSSRVFIEDFLEAQGLSYDDFDSISEVDHPTAIIQSIKWSRPSNPITDVAIVSRVAIEYELKYNHLYESSINNTPIIKKYYIVYRENSEQITIIKNICEMIV
ncbi:MAG: hypothetical protein DRG30_03000 [Epsilonproteobacteria bacterium]|nr:MAG: hypothetical protein DRG30_03000 [Campylobacterota bacterium]